MEDCEDFTGEVEGAGDQNAVAGGARELKRLGRSLRDGVGHLGADGGDDGGELGGGEDAAAAEAGQDDIGSDGD